MIECYLLLHWLRAVRSREGKPGRICFMGFLVGQMYLLWEVVRANRVGSPVPGSADQDMFIARFLLGGTLGGLFTILGLFHLAAVFTPRRD